MLVSNTPQFDALLDKILEELKPHSRVCLECKKEFKIEDKDIELLKMFRSPAPKLCPECRQRRRLSFANYSSIYRRKCKVSGHTDIMISQIAPCMPWITYDHETYYSDLWDPFSYGKDVEKDKTFFQQFLDLEKEVPQPGVHRGANSPNSDFSFYGKDMKNCYYVFGGRRSEDIMYSSSIYDSKHILDSYFLRKVDIGYNNISNSDCYKCFNAFFSSNCIDCHFIYDCRNCQNCFGCVNLRNKNYCYFNKQLIKEEYLKKIEEINLGSRLENDRYNNLFWEFIKSNPIRAIRIFQSENVSGNDIKRSKNCKNVFQTEDSENVRYSSFVIFLVKDSMDTGFSGRAERNYEDQNVSANSFNVKFSFSVKESTNSDFLISCSNCHNCFGCIGLKNVSYCIFNKQYEQKEYWEKVDQIKTKMLQGNEYGEFFPMSFSPYAYNSSLANIIYPMTEEEAKNRGLYWQEDIDVDIKNLKTIQAIELPDNIENVTEEICKLVIIGKVSKKPFKITARELEFYKRYKIPLPTDTPYQRIIERFKILNNFKIFREVCDSCGKQIESVYKKSDGYRPYCEQCYQKEIL
ncbi:MAG: hypothetical protein WC822_03900 [Candidatus Paceibacterota bacterium]|jgi:hypothetical protein